MFFTDLTYLELKEMSPRVEAVLIPLGCTEQQGPHMTVGFDTTIVSALCRDVSARLDADGLPTLVMPSLPFGPTPEHVNFGSGYVNLRQSTHEAVVADILNSLAAQGFRRMLIWRGCGQHELERVIDTFNGGSTNARAYQPLADYGSIARSVLGDVAGGHADSFATSVAMHLDSERVYPERIPGPSGPVAWSDDMDFAAISPSGVLGDASRASAENGRLLWQRCVGESVTLVKQVIAGDTVRERWHHKDGFGVL
jgi:creatinine amidohydrolase